jgi:murein DD-endopeptidase MepM/ murein hydrolase activator NlpD|tara:strand:+ start:23653 stop:24630 length:978 start_codon:yes stop_codon:yes gene_type:complete
MSKSKFYYDKKSLSFKEIKTSNRVKIINISTFIFVTFIFGIISLFILISTPYLNTPTELSQDRELKNYEFQLEILNKRLNQLENVLNNLELRDNNIYRVLFEANPIDPDIRKAGFGGINRYSDLEGFKNSNLIIETTKKIDILTKQLVIQSKSLDEIETLAKNKQLMLAAIPSIQPIKNDDLNRIASGYGIRTDPFDKSRKMHSGMDFSAPRNTPVYAASNGIISRADNRAIGYGKHIRINHGFGYLTLYAHLNSYNVVRGQNVKKGDIIGFVGNTGRSKGVHLHYEVHKDGKKVNPVNYFYSNLSAEEFDEILKISSQENQSLD